VIVSIVTPWKDQPELLSDFEAAVERADEVIVVDNASDARTQWILREAAQRHANWRIIRNEENLFFAPAVNMGLRFASGQVRVTVNNDIAGPPDWIDGVRRDVEEGGLYGPKVMEREPYGMPCRYVEGWCIAATRETWKRLDYFDADAYPLCCWEDNDLSLRSVVMGIKLIRTDWPLLHKGSATRKTIPSADDDLLVNEARFVSRLWKARRAGQVPLEASAWSSGLSGPSDRL
jgi:GT2 family glycosyltransferase